MKLLAGNPGKRALPKNEPQPQPRIPACPKHLTGEARKEWRRMSRDLLALGLLTGLDRAVLALYCQAWARWVEAEEVIARPGFEAVEVTDRGYAHANPWLSIAKNAAEECRRLAVEFGMTPASRSRVTPAHQDEADPYEQFLKGKRAGTEG